ncbi:hypothetical protein J2T09_004650 [Neorhizobium huautlense]|uniref:Uncharacterized protein n=1 Tax=Neorhizobium huautlense TaxID=67774 RepID=A0ABT9Q071_9HYPH|nr:hypothetical protein [Neorhizobium huautlense]MDP9839870.1 hypothetical protein [Neorhizobium huautlense]
MIKTCRHLFGSFAIVTVVSLLPIAATPAQAIEVGRVAGHSVEIKKEDFEAALSVDGRQLHKNSIILFDEIVSINGVLALVGSSSPGGNACDGSPFVLSFAETPRLDGPIDSCVSIEHRVEGDRIAFSALPVPGRKTERWEWTLAGGFKTLSATEFQPTAGSGWDNLRERKLTHPADAFRNQEVSASVRSLVGPDFDYFQELMIGVGSGEFKGDDFVGSACRPHNCDEEAGLLFLSRQDRAVFAAWKPAGKKIVVHPNVKAWPEKAKSELRIWARQWE